VALLADDHFGNTIHPVHLFLPVEVLLSVGAGLLAGKIIFLAIDEQNDVGVLFDRSRFTQVGELRALVVAVLDLAGELRQCHDRYREFLGQRLEAHGDFGNFLHAALRRPA